MSMQIILLVRIFSYIYIADCTQNYIVSILIIYNNILRIYNIPSKPMC